MERIIFISAPRNTGLFPAWRKKVGGRDVAKRYLVLLSVVLGAALAGAQTAGANLGGPDPDLKASFVGSPLACSQPLTVIVPTKLAPRAKIKARLITLLRESLFDDAKGLVNIGREDEIKKLASKLKSEKE